MPSSSSCPARSVFPLPDVIPFEQGAVMMCSSATAFTPCARAGWRPARAVAVFGAGGLGMSAIQLARALGALTVFAVDLDAGRLALAERLGASPVDAGHGDPAAEIRRLNGGRGVDVALDFVGIPATLRPAIASLAPFGRVVAVGLGDQPVSIYPYQEIINREAEIIGCSDHLASEIPLLTELVRRGSARPGAGGDRDDTAGRRRHQRGDGPAGAVWRGWGADGDRNVAKVSRVRHFGEFSEFDVKRY